MKKILVIAAAVMFLGWFFGIRVPGGVGMPADEAVDIARPPVASPANRPSFAIQVDGLPANVTPEADYEASGIVMMVNRPWGSSAVTPGTVVLGWGFDPSHREPTTTPEAKGKVGMVAVMSLTDDRNLQRTVANLKRGQRVRMKGYRSRLTTDRVVMQSANSSNNRVELVYLTEIQADDTVYEPASPPET